MAMKVNDEPIVQKSTGRVKGPQAPVEHAQTDDNASSGAVAYEPPGETSVDHHGADAVVRYPTPGPVTLTLSWAEEAQAKVITAEEKPEPKKSATAETKSE